MRGGRIRGIGGIGNGGIWCAIVAAAVLAIAGREKYPEALLDVKLRRQGYLDILEQSKVGTTSLFRACSDGGLLVRINGLFRMKTHLDSYSDKLELARNLQQTWRTHELALACLQRSASSTVKAGLGSSTVSYHMPGKPLHTRYVLSQIRGREGVLYSAALLSFEP